MFDQNQNHQVCNYLFYYSFLKNEYSRTIYVLFVTKQISPTRNSWRGWLSETTFFWVFSCYTMSTYHIVQQLKTISGTVILGPKYERYFKSFAPLSRALHVVTLWCSNCVHMLLKVFQVCIWNFNWLKITRWPKKKVTAVTPTAVLKDE